MVLTPPLHVYLDESRLRVGDGPENLYVVVAAQARLDVQAELRSLLPAGVRRLHFRDDKPDVRRRHLTLLAAFAEAGRLEAVEAHALIPSARRERAARERCLSALAGDLAQRGVGELVIESRQDHQDQRDSRTLLTCRSHGVVPHTLQWRVGRPKSEPLLWPPDTLAGLLGHGLRGDTWSCERWFPTASPSRSGAASCRKRRAPGSRSDRGIPGLTSGGSTRPAQESCPVARIDVKTLGPSGSS
jgi:hypothetical protein